MYVQEEAKELPRTHASTHCYPTWCMLHFHSYLVLFEVGPDPPSLVIG